MKSTWTQISKSISENSFHLIQQISSFNPLQTTCSQFLFWISVPFRSRAMLYACFAFWTLQQRPVQSFNKSIETMQKTHVFSEILGFMPSPWKFAEKCWTKITWKWFGREEDVSMSLYPTETVLRPTFCWVWGLNLAKWGHMPERCLGFLGYKDRRTWSLRMSETCRAFSSVLMILMCFYWFDTWMRWTLLEDAQRKVSLMNPQKRPKFSTKLDKNCIG